MHIYALSSHPCDTGWSTRRRASTRGATVFFSVVVMLAAMADSPDVANSPKVERVSEAQYRIGEIAIDKKARTVCFPAVVNMDKDLVEYYCVTETGKTHEAVLRTSVVPRHLHTAVLLISREGEIPAPIPEGVPLDKLSGTPIEIFVKWEVEKEAREYPASQLLRYIESKKTPRNDLWIYTSSRFVGNHFIADQQGDIVALLENADALMNINHQDRQNDELWEVNEELVPPVGTAVEVILRLPKSEDPKEEASSTNPSPEQGTKK